MFEDYDWRNNTTGIYSLARFAAEEITIESDQFKLCFNQFELSDFE